MRAFWTGALSFGLVNIPIRAYPASEEHALEFDMLHKKDLSPIRYARICKLDGEEIPYSDIVKGYEYEKGEYVVVDEEDFQKANPRKTKTIDVQNFVLLDEIDTIYFEKPYFLEPDKKADKAYNLLREALKQSKKVAVATFVFRNREHIGIVRPFENALLLIQMRYSSELRSADELAVTTTKTTNQELSVVLKLIEQLTVPFKPEKYKDTYIEELRLTIKEKLKGKKPASKRAPELRNKASTDLMHLLKSSLQQSLKEKPAARHTHGKKPVKRRHPKQK